MCSADVPLPLPKPARHPLNTFPNNLRHPTLHSRVYFQGTQSKTWKHYKILCVTLPLPHHRPHIHTHEHTSTCTSMYTQQTFTCMYIVIGTHAHIHLNASLAICMHAQCMHIHIYSWAHSTHVQLCACTHTHKHTHTHTNLAVQENVFWFQVPADIERKGNYDVEATPALLLRQRTKFTGISSGFRDPHTPWLLGRKGQAWLCATGRPHL